MGTTVHDVAAYILERSGPMTAMKLQKLAYYAQGWHLASQGSALFPEAIEAWAGGPVCPQLYERHRGRRVVESPWPEGSMTQIDDHGAEAIVAALGLYGHLSGDDLSLMTHREQPWLDARRGLPEGARSSRVIDVESLRGYFTEVNEYLRVQLFARRSASDQAFSEGAADVERQLEKNMANGEQVGSVSAEEFSRLLRERLVS